MKLFDFLHITRKNRLPELFWHTDLHSHICPGIDDGSPTVEKSVRLATAMQELGFTSMIVTPHTTDEVFPNTPSIVADSFNQLRTACAEAGLDMKFSVSCEYRIDEFLFDLLRRNMVFPLPGDYLLVENSWLQEPGSFDQFMFELRNTYGLKPILAHPERYPYYQKHRERYKQMHDNGILFQVNMMSLGSHPNHATRQTAQYLLDNKMIDFIGSDLHRTTHIEYIRDFLCSKNYRKLEKLAPQILNDTLKF